MQIDSGVVAADDRAFSLAQTALDELARMRESVSSGKGVSTANGLIAQIQALASPAAAAVAAPEPAPVPATTVPRTCARSRSHGVHTGSSGSASADASSCTVTDRLRARSEGCPAAGERRGGTHAQTWLYSAATARGAVTRPAGARRRVGAFVRAAFHRDPRRRARSGVRGLRQRFRERWRRQPMDRCCRRAQCRRAASPLRRRIAPSSRASTPSCSISCSTTPAKPASRARVSSSRSAPSISTWASCRAR